MNQISFRIGSLAELRQWHDIVRKEYEVSDMSHGNSWSVYFRDPEGNRIELFVQTPWYVLAPRGMKLDLAQSDQ
jgi:catechol-2,3-dioxygenase